jgi:hypothetical protein
VMDASRPGKISFWKLWVEDLPGVLFSSNGKFDGKFGGCL